MQQEYGGGPLEQAARDPELHERLHPTRRRHAARRRPTGARTRLLQVRTLPAAQNRPLRLLRADQSGGLVSR